MDGVEALVVQADGTVDESGVGTTIVNAKRLLNGAEPIVITIPEQLTIDPGVLAPAVDSPAEPGLQDRRMEDCRLSKKPVGRE